MYIRKHNFSWEGFTDDESFYETLKQIEGIVGRTMERIIGLPHNTYVKFREAAYHYEWQITSEASGQTDVERILSAQVLMNRIWDNITRRFPDVRGGGAITEVECEDSYQQSPVETSINVAFVGKEECVIEATQRFGRKSHVIKDFMGDEKIAHFYVKDGVESIEEKLKAIESLKWFIASDKQKRTSDKGFPTAVKEWQTKE